MLCELKQKVSDLKPEEILWRIYKSDERLEKETNYKIKTMLVLVQF